MSSNILELENIEILLKDGEKIDRIIDYSVTKNAYIATTATEQGFNKYIIEKGEIKYIIKRYKAKL